MFQRWIGLAALALVCIGGMTKPAVAQAPELRWRVFDSRADMLDRAQVRAFGTIGGDTAPYAGFGSPPLEDVLAAMTTPQAHMIALELPVNRALTLGVGKTFDVLPSVLSQQQQRFQPALGGGAFYQPGTFDGLVQFIAEIRLDLGAHDATYRAPPGFRWNIMYAPGGLGPQGTIPNVGISFHYEWRF